MPTMPFCRSMTMRAVFGSSVVSAMGSFLIGGIDEALEQRDGPRQLFLLGGRKRSPSARNNQSSRAARPALIISGMRP